MAIDPAGRFVVTGDAEGVVRVGSVTGGEPHILFGHTGRVTGVALSPDGRWVFAAAGSEIRQWPTPDVSKPPLHTLPHEELMARLESFTNLQVVRDQGAPVGWRLDGGSFPGWETTPSWW